MATPQRTGVGVGKGAGVVKRRWQTWAIVALGALGLIPAFVFGLWGFVSATTVPIHRSVDELPSQQTTDVAPEWSDAVARARQQTRASIAELNLPAASVAVAVGGKLAWAEAFGWANIDERLPVTPDTQFRIGTASMAMTSTGIGVLLEEQAIDLDADIRRYVPAYPEKAWPVTVRQLMAHTGGLRPDEGDEEPVWTPCARPADAIERFGEFDLLAQPGTRYRFSSYGWALLSAAVEAAAHDRFAPFMRARVFEPLGMTQTTTDAPGQPVLSRAEFYFPRFAADTRYGPQGLDPIDTSCFSGAAAFLSTPTDMVRFIVGLDRGALLRQETLSSLQADQQLPDGQPTGYGLGWDLERVDVAGQSLQSIGHDGDLRGGMVATLMFLPDRDLVIAVTANTAFADTPLLARQIAEAFLSTGRMP